MPVTSILNALDRGLSVLEGVLITILMLAALVVGTAQVVLRYVFNTGFPWSESIFVLTTVAAMLFAGSRAVRDDKHVRVELLPMVAPRPLRTALQLVSHAAALALCGFFTYCGLLYTDFAYGMGAIEPASGLPEWLIYSLVPVTMSAFTLRYVIRLVRTLRGEDVPLHGVAGTAGAVLERRP